MKHLPLEFWSAWNRELHQAGATFLLGELLDGDPAVVSQTWSAGGFDAMFDFPLGFAINDVFCRGASPARLASVLSNDRRYPDPSRLVTLVDNHDLPRVMSACGGDVDKVRDALAFLLTARGIPSLTWGTEVGLDGAKEPDNRKSMRFVDHPLKAEITSWLSLRKLHPALMDGTSTIVESSTATLSVLRVSDDQVALVMIGPERPLPSLPAAIDPKALVAIGPAERSVRVMVSALTPGRFSALRVELDAQWRRGGTTRAVTIEGPPGCLVVGSGPELGEWKPERAVPLPVTIELPLGHAFELKALRRSRDRVQWAEGANQLLFVEASTARLVLPAVFSNDGPR